MAHPTHERAASVRIPRAIRALAFAAASMAVLLSAACGKHIGDGCATNIDCSLNAERRCDTSQPGGYCTIPECEPDQCPDNAMCVQFEATLPRLAKRFCESPCMADNQCRGGFVCQQPTVRAPATCPPYDPDGGAEPPACNRLLDLHPIFPTAGYCVPSNTTPGGTGPGTHDP